MIQKRPTSAHAPRELRQTEMDGEVLRDLQRALAIHLGLLSEQFHAYLAREILLVAFSVRSPADATQSPRLPIPF